jgi:magnesium chelatase subunit D
LADAAGSAAASRARDALLAAAVFALDPAAIGGIVLRTDRAAACERWLAQLHGLLDPELPLRRLPPHIDDQRLLGGIDLAATLSCGRPVHARGLLAEADGGVILMSMAERIPVRMAALLAAALDHRSVVASARAPAAAAAPRFGLVALDSGQGEDERCPAVLSERLALQVDLNGVDADDLVAPGLGRAAVALARSRIAAVQVDAGALAALCTAAAACGIDSLRAPLLALRVARACAALDGRDALGDADLERAARLVLGPRARVVPVAEAQSEGEQSEPDPQQRADAPPRQTGATPEQGSGAAGDADDGVEDSDALAQQLLAAARATLPAGLLAGMTMADAVLRNSSTAGRAGAAILRGRRGRPAGVRSGRPRQGSRLNIVATLRAAAPWQRLRRAQAHAAAPRVLVRAEDFCVTWFRQRSETATLFVLDASGSSAMHRLAEVKGAVELLLAECYVRRDQVALVAFRGRGAQLVLPPTRSLVRAKRCLAGLPGGGATPLAAGLALGLELAEQLRRRGLAPALVILTDGHANIARDGGGGRERAQQDALLVARLLRAAAFKSLLIDTAPRAQPQARALAAAMRASYLPLPYADARALLDAVQSAA